MLAHIMERESSEMMTVTAVAISPNKNAVTNCPNNNITLEKMGPRCRYCKVNLIFNLVSLKFKQNLH